MNIQIIAAQTDCLSEHDLDIIEENGNISDDEGADHAEPVIIEAETEKTEPQPVDVEEQVQREATVELDNSSLILDQLIPSNSLGSISNEDILRELSDPRNTWVKSLMKAAIVDCTLMSKSRRNLEETLEDYAERQARLELETAHLLDSKRKFDQVESEFKETKELLHDSNIKFKKLKAEIAKEDEDCQIAIQQLIESTKAKKEAILCKY